MKTKFQVGDRVSVSGFDSHCFYHNKRKGTVSSPTAQDDEFVVKLDDGGEIVVSQTEFSEVKE